MAKIIRVAYDMRPLGTAYAQRGVGKATECLYLALRKLRPDIKFHLIGYGEPKQEWLEGGVEWAPVPRPRGRFGPYFQGRRLKERLRKIHPHLFHATMVLGPIRDVFLPARLPVPLLACVQDLNVFLLESFADLGGGYFFKQEVKCLLQAAKIHCPSQVTASGLLHRWPRLKSRVKTIPLGPTHAPLAEAVDFTKNKYLLFMGDEENKNINYIFEAFTVIREKFPECKLLGLGRPEKIQALVEPELWEAAAGHVEIKGDLSDKQVQEVLRRARIFLFPSINEGFGFPLLEAMAAGVPIICSELSSMPEVAGPAGCYVDPNNPAELVSAVDTLWNNDNLARALVQKGREQLARFTWEKTAAAVAALYEGIAKK
jgi:glycosyltransferase involved in cell wall biosynthesis